MLHRDLLERAEDLHARTARVAGVRRRLCLPLPVAGLGRVGGVLPRRGRRSARRYEPALLDLSRADRRHVRAGPLGLRGASGLGADVAPKRRVPHERRRLQPRPLDSRPGLSRSTTEPTLVGTLRLDAPLPARTGAQINDVFARAGAASLSTANGVVVVDGGSSPLLAYAAVIDSATSDPIFVSGAEDASPPPPAGPETLIISVRAWDFSPGGPISPPMTLRVGTTYTLVFRNADLPGDGRRATRVFRGFRARPDGERRHLPGPRLRRPGIHAAGLAARQLPVRLHAERLRRRPGAARRDDRSAHRRVIPVGVKMAA